MNSVRASREISQRVQAGISARKAELLEEIEESKEIIDTEEQEEAEYASEGFMQLPKTTDTEVGRASELIDQEDEDQQIIIEDLEVQDQGLIFDKSEVDKESIVTSNLTINSSSIITNIFPTTVKSHDF